MPHSLLSIYLHIVFTTQDRNPFLRDEETRDSVHRYLAGVANHHGSPAVQVGGVEDHVHMLVRFGNSQNIPDLVRDLKRSSSIMMKKNVPDF